MKRKIGLYGGSFDPPHLGHLHLAVSLQEFANLDEIWWIPAACSPHKEQVTTSPDHRCQMLNLMICRLSSHRILDVECKNPPPSYTFNTVDQLIREFPENEFYWMLGADCLKKFHTWYCVDQLVEIVNFVVASRFESGIQDLDLYLKQKMKCQFFNIPMLDISSSRIRDRIKQYLYCEHLVSLKVLDYIYENRLYL